MTWYTTFETNEGQKAAYTYKTKRQLVAAVRCGAFKGFKGATHYKTDKGLRAVENELRAAGRITNRAVEADEYSGCDFLLPYPGIEFMQRKCFY